jgi:hypothetical protein
MLPGFKKFVCYRPGQRGHIPACDWAAEGVVFSCGRVALSWLVDGRGAAFYDSLDAALSEVLADGKTELVWAEVPK